MSSFSKLSLVAQYDDMCRYVRQIIEECGKEEEASIAMSEEIQRRWSIRETGHERNREDLRGEITSLQREIKKLNRQLTESRNALQREIEKKKVVEGEKDTYKNLILKIKNCFVNEVGFGSTEAHRKRVIKYLDVGNLSPIQSDDSDDNVSGLDYDRTEEDIAEALDNIASNEQPTLPYRYFDRANEEQPQCEAPRRSSRRSGSSHNHRASHVASKHSLPNLNKDRYDETTPPETDSNEIDFDDNGYEYAKQQLEKYEAEKREKLASVISTPSMKLNNKGATLSARSTTSLKSICNTPRSQEHKFARKKCIMPESCGPCGGKISFYGNVCKCEQCGVICHPECQDKAPVPCVKITAPATRSRSKKILIADYVNSDAELKVPALIVHCCNEIEKDYNIETTGLYQVVERTNAIEDLQQKILKSKSGMPNLSKSDVHLLTGVVKRFLQSLDESLITTTIWSRFAEVIKTFTDPEARNERMTYFIEGDLPSANRQTLAYLMQHLHAIAKHSNKNMMTTQTLAKRLAPTIVGNSCRNPSPQLIQRESKTQIQIMEALFDINEEFWSIHAPKTTPIIQTDSLGSRLLATPSRTDCKTTRSSRIGGTLPTPKLKPFFS